MKMHEDLGGFASAAASAMNMNGICAVPATNADMRPLVQPLQHTVGNSGIIPLCRVTLVTLVKVCSVNLA